MGYGSYTASDWSALKKRKKLSESSTADSIFTSKNTSEAYSVSNIGIRESRDSIDSPQAIPVIIGFDVTSSMGYLASELALNSLNKTIMNLCSGTIIRYPHIMCSAIGDCKSDRSPLQATQFEADIKIMEQLTELCLEGGGGGNDGESYNLLWYFAYKHTESDHFEKRNGKGCLITVGDDKCHRSITRREIHRVFGDNNEYDLSNEELLRQVREKYNVFHINIEKGSVHDYQVLSMWQELMPGCVTVIQKKDISVLSELITSITALSCGISREKVMTAMDNETVKKLSRSIAMLGKNEKADKKRLVF